MADFFNFNFNFPFGMNSWFMPNWSFPMFYQPFQMPSFNMFSWFNPFSFSLNNPFVSPSLSVFSDFSNSYPDYSANTDTFVKSKPSVDYSKDSLKLNGYNAFKGEKLEVPANGDVYMRLLEPVKVDLTNGWIFE